MNEDLYKRLLSIEKRNQKVELEKAWETSVTRRASIAALTYIVVVTYLLVIHNQSPFINGLVPVAGFLLSTLVLPQIRSIWQKNK